MKKLLSIIFLSCSPFIAFASNGGAASLPIYDLILLPLSLEFSGPLPLVLGTIGLSVAAITFLSGCHHQEGARRFFFFFFGVGTALAAPNAIEMITGFLIP